MNRAIVFPLALLFTAVILRGALLEYTDLIDPTETRYASVAQEMVLGENWLTPQLPMPEGVVPYMGKPPLHFWLTAGSYSVFGVDEWTARLPSWLAAIAILCIIGSFGYRFFGEQTALSALLIAFSSGMFFFLTGASVTDVSLTAFVSSATFLLYLYALSHGTRTRLAVFSSILMALAFLTKGPVAIVLVWLPLLLWSALQKNFQWLRGMPWVPLSLIFLAVAAPWFIANEMSIPGSLHYFFWNENIARYLFTEYGDKYGTGHVHSYGVSWLMLSAAFAPWTIVLAWEIYRLGWRRLAQRLRTDQQLGFVCIWGISGALFFTFVRQMNAMYLLPCIPGLALFTAALLEMKGEESRPSLIDMMKSQEAAVLVALISIGIITTGAVLTYSSTALILGGVLGVGGVSVLSRLNMSRAYSSAVPSLALASFLIYLLVIVDLGPYVDERRSAAELLKDLADATIDERAVPEVGITTKNSYSLYWTSKAWEEELSRDLHVQYVEPDHIPKNVKHVILRADEYSKLPQRFRSDFLLDKQRGKWQLYSRRKHKLFI